MYYTAGKQRQDGSVQFHSVIFCSIPRDARYDMVSDDTIHKIDHGTEIMVPIE
jgi:hypothetical protein